MGKYEPAEIRLRKYRLFLVALYHHHSTKHANQRRSPKRVCTTKITVSLDPFGTHNKKQAGAGGK